MRFKPLRVYFEPTALDYPLGRKIRDRVQSEGIPIYKTTAHNQVRNIPGETPKELYAQAKRTLVVGVRRTLKFQTSKPSADYALPLITGCPGHCQYCYLQTTLGPKPHVRVYVNLEDIFHAAERYIEQRNGEKTVFEGSCVSDPVAVEHYTSALASSIQFFAEQKNGYFRFVTKYDEVDSLLGLNHNNHTEIRFSLNARTPIRLFEHAVPGIQARLDAARKVHEAGYPFGFLIAPIFLYDGWVEEYEELMELVAAAFSDVKHIPFELITHRYTPKAKSLILQRYPESKLPMDDEERVWKFGQFGYGKYLYTKELRDQIRDVFEAMLNEKLDAPIIKYSI